VQKSGRSGEIQPDSPFPSGIENFFAPVFPCRRQKRKVWSNKAGKLAQQQNVSNLSDLKAKGKN
jgi:hypothetical protein